MGEQTRREWRWCTVGDEHRCLFALSLFSLAAAVVHVPALSSLFSSLALIYCSIPLFDACSRAADARNQMKGRNDCGRPSKNGGSRSGDVGVVSLPSASRVPFLSCCMWREPTLRCTFSGPRGCSIVLQRHALYAYLLSSLTPSHAPLLQRTCSVLSAVRCPHISGDLFFFFRHATLAASSSPQFFPPLPKQ